MTQSSSPRRARPRDMRTPEAAPTATPSLWNAGPAARAIIWPDLPDTAPASAIRDSLYDLIPLGALELDLLATPAFTRLQGIKQLGFVYRVWPGATHTRFEHSLGVYYLMLRGLRALLASDPGGLAATGLTEEDAQTALAAALLHDIGHYPFSHAIEELGYPVTPHERVGRQIIETDEVAAALQRHGLRAARVADMIDSPKDRPLEPGAALLARLLSGPLDVDKLDYLPRDARACNVPYGGVDVSRLLGALRVIPTPEGPRLGVSDKGISPLNSLLHARQEMFDNVYWHHTNRAMMVMLLRATQEAILAGAVTGASLSGHDDASLLALLSDAAMPEATRQLVGALRARRPYKTALEISASAGKPYQLLDSLFWDQNKRRRVEEALAAETSVAFEEPVAPWELLIDIPKPEKWEMNTLVAFADPPLGMRSLMTWAEATGQRPDDLGLYERHQRRIRIVCHERWRDRIRAVGQPALLAAIERIPAL
ncbi:MAG TPA: HD domain-containing protein [Ktedonobacterales bacterium]|nr:HD domain-containing protein [Ktedonobacterales bacterium]